MAVGCQTYDAILVSLQKLVGRYSFLLANEIWHDDDDLFESDFESVSHLDPDIWEDQMWRKL